MAVIKTILQCLVFFMATSFLPGSFSQAAGSGDKISIYLFTVKGCMHCLEEKNFLAKIEKKYLNTKVVEIEVTTKKDNQELFRRVGELLDIKLAVVPFTVIGNIPIAGWHDEQTTGAAIERAIFEVQERGLPDVIAPLLPPDAFPPSPAKSPQIPEALTLPLIGEIQIKHFSLALLTAIIGALDGFNPCAMWALVFLISLLLGMQNQKRIWALGGIFIFGSGLVYFLFMSAWLNVFLYLGLIVWIRVAVGAIALVAAGLNVRAYFLDKSGSCPLDREGRKHGLMEKIKAAVSQQSFLLAAGGIFLLGVAVNLVELFCSAGLPVVYTQILTLSQLPLWQYYAYLALYILVFMLDDLLVFVVSILTLQHLGITARYRRFSNLIGGLVLAGVGLLLIFKPEVLMFG